MPRFEIQEWRSKLWHAAVDQIDRLAATGIYYDPSHDARFQWAMQLLDLHEGYRQSIDVDVKFTAEMLIAPRHRELAPSELAAGEKPHTLAQG